MEDIQFLFFGGDKVSLCPGTHSVDKVSLELRGLPASDPQASASLLILVVGCGFLAWFVGFFGEGKLFCFCSPGQL